MKALVFRGKVVQIEQEEFPVHESLQWVDVTGLTPTPEVEWSYDGVLFTAPPPPPLPPPSKAEIIDAAFKQDAMAGLLGEVADLKGVTEAQLIANIKARRGA